MISSVIIILCAAFATALAQIVLKKGSAFSFSGFTDEFSREGINIIYSVFDASSEMFHLFMIGTGFLLFMVTLLLLARGFKGGDMSVLYPVFASSFIWNIIFSRVFIGEEVNIFKVVGVLFIVGGIGLIGLGHKKQGVAKP